MRSWTIAAAIAAGLIGADTIAQTVIGLGCGFWGSRL